MSSSNCFDLTSLPGSLAHANLCLSIDIKMIPSEIFAEDLMSTVIRYGLYIGAAFQLACLMACVTLTDEQSEPHPYEKAYTDSDECSSEQSSPGHRAAMSRARRHDKKKRR